MHARANMGSREQAVMGLETQAFSARATKHFVTIFCNTCNDKVSNVYIRTRYGNFF